MTAWLNVEWKIAFTSAGESLYFNHGQRASPDGKWGRENNEVALFIGLGLVVAQGISVDPDEHLAIST